MAKKITGYLKLQVPAGAAVQLVARREPHVVAVVGDTRDIVDTGKRAVLANDFSI